MAVFFVQANSRVCDEMKQSAVVVFARLLNTEVKKFMAFEHPKAAVEEEIVETFVTDLPDTPDESDREELEEEEKSEESKVINALQKENARLRKKNRRLDSPEVLEESKEAPEMRVPEPQVLEPSEAQSLIYSAWQEEALEDFLESHSEYEDDGLWKQFRTEWEDRSSIVAYAKRQGRPITRKLFMERFNSIHRSLGGDETDVRENATKDALKAHSLARIAQTGSSKGSPKGQDAPVKVRPKAFATPKHPFADALERLKK